MVTTMLSRLLPPLLLVGAAVAGAEGPAGALELSSPLVTKGRPFAVALRVLDAGEATDRDGSHLALRAISGGDLSSLGKAAVRPPQFVSVGQGGSGFWVWDGLTAPSVGDWTLACDRLGSEHTVRFHVFDQDPVTLPDRPEKPRVSLLLNSPIRAVLENEWARLSFVWEQEGDGYAIAEVWNGARWQRAGSLYPLARLAVEVDGACEELALRIGSVKTESNRFYINAQGFNSKGESWPINVAYTLDPDTPLFRMDYNLGAPRPTNLFAFHGPTILAGDRAFGARKQSALFPGLDPLGADEASPLHLPAEEGIATPLMAVEGGGTLIAMLWPRIHEWREGMRGTSALFRIPRPDSPIAYCGMGLSVPPHGGELPEDQEETRRPAALEKLGRVWLTGCLVLEHDARRGGGAGADGLGEHGLLRRVVDRWSQVYGPPKPARPPRD